MEANELRIGNYVYWNIPEKLNVLHKVVGIRNGRPQTIPISLGDSIENYKPIPLTEDILLKCGYKVYKDSMFCGIIGPLGFVKDEGKYFLCTQDDTGYILDDAVQIESLHQLQNLYFALTGNELTVNL